jgi:hypothetical protein
MHEGPYGGRGPSGDGTLWTGVFPGDEVQIEVLSPPGAEGPFAGFVDEVVHFYRPWMEPAEDGDLRAGTCHNDVMCFPAWHPLHNATAMVAYSVGSSTFVCGATLLSTTSGDETPYLLTASHCINQESVANTVGAYWFFQTVACDGANETQVISSNATLLWTSGVVDMTLLMLRGALPDGLTWAGWSTTTNLANGTDVACIHHPTGARKKISFGDEIDHPFGDPTNYWGVGWTSGVIEVGSSGGGLYIASTQQLIGVTSHSSQPIDCTNADGPSGFGKFGQAYPNISTLLAAGADDTFEPNDTCATAITLNAGTANNLVVKSLDEDWYRITLPANRKLTVDAIFAHAWGDVDLELYGACGGTLLASSRGNSNNEQLTRIGNFCTSGTYYLRVCLDSDTRNEYSLTVTMSNCADGDGDCNGLVNLADYSSRAACATKPGGSAPAGCDMHNFDCDSDVDLRDFAAFQQAFTGP